VADSTTGKLQIYSTEERGADFAICIVRCVGGVVHSGFRFLIESTDDAENAASPTLSLDWIKRYDRMMDFIDPPHSAMVRLSGKSVSLLERGVILTTASADD
jgi:hypothetical protein